MISIEYLAGLVDGEGCITITKTKSSKYKRGIQYYSRLSIEMTSEHLINKLYTQFGGSFNRRKPQIKRKDIYVWSVYGENARLIIEQIKPYLIVKDNQASIIQEFQSLVNKNNFKPVTDEEWVLRESLCNKIRILNKRG